MSLVFAIVSIISFAQKFEVSIGHYILSNENEYIDFAVKNIFDNPIRIRYIKIIDTSKNVTFYYSDEFLIINNCNGIANVYNDVYHIKINRLYNINSSNIHNAIYKVEIQYNVIWTNGNPSYIETEYFYTNYCIGILSNSYNTAIENINYTNIDNKYYDLAGNIINNPQKGKIYIHNNKKVIF